MKIICARLVTGEEIIGKLVTPTSQLIGGSPQVEPFQGDTWEIPQDSTGNVVLEDVRIVAIQEVPGRGVGISFIPYTLANPEAKVWIDLRKHAMSVFPPERNLERAYIGENSKIALATTETARAQGIKLN